MIEVAQIAYGCNWAPDGHVMAWPLRITFGAKGPEVPVDEMLEGRGYAVLLPAQLIELIRSMTPADTKIELMAPAPEGLASQLIEAGFYVALC